MKLFIPLLFVLLTCSFLTINQKTKGTLTIQIDHVTLDKGEVLIAIFNSKDDFLKDDKAIPLIVSANNQGSLTPTIELDYGTYAISLFHDVNSNKKLDVNGLGIPIEPYGFSNNAPATFGPPSFMRASFEFTTDRQVQIIKLSGKAKKN